MNESRRKNVYAVVRFNRVAKLFIKRFSWFIWDRIFACTARGRSRYRHLPLDFSLSPPPPPPPPFVNCLPIDCPPPVSDKVGESDLVALKISLLGDCRIGKTSFMVKYVGNEQSCLQMSGLNLMDKTLFVKGVTISYSIWDLGGDHNCLHHLPIACKDASAILFMFDLTSRCTLRSVIRWYIQARKWNETAIPILIGTKFDDFIRFPLEMQWTIVTEARAYAKFMKATLFFSSSTHNINVNKIFKFITAKFFNLPWTLQRNLTIGEPIIDF